MTERVLVLGISEDAHICNSIFSAFGDGEHKAICVPSPQKALQLFDGGLKADFLLVDTSRKIPGDDFMLPSLLQKVRNENIGLVVDAEDLSWNEYALKWNLHLILATPFRPRDIDMLKKNRESTPWLRRLRSQKFQHPLRNTISKSWTTIVFSWLLPPS